MSIYISRSNNVSDEFLGEFLAHLQIIGYKGPRDYWKRGSKYSSTPLVCANAVILLIDSSACLISKGSYDEYILAKSLNLPVFLAYKTKNYGFQFYTFSVDRINNNMINCAKITFGINCSEKVYKDTLKVTPSVNTEELPEDSGHFVEQVEEIVLNIELLLLRSR